ncbi:hypothetical protein IHE61_31035 [Streptomyces sp. GKU 257-1]|nr:hypothetical protein [Streptomyces sp. GKU 257-1]
MPTEAAHLQPQPGDLITTHPDTPGCDPHTTYVIADHWTGHNALELNHPTSHPQHWDWAALITPPTRWPPSPG